MQEVLWTITGWICKGIGILMLISAVCFFASIIWNMVTNGGRKWYYYNPSKPWKGGYYAPLLPDYPPYNEYKWNPETCRFEHNKTGQPLNSEDKPRALQSHRPKKRPEWLRFLLEENIGTLMEKRKRKKWAEQRDREKPRIT